MKDNAAYHFSDATHVYCESCGDAPVIFGILEKDDLNGDKYWGDILCGKCHLVIATLSKIENEEKDAKSNSI